MSTRKPKKAVAAAVLLGGGLALATPTAAFAAGTSGRIGDHAPGSSGSSGSGAKTTSNHTLPTIGSTTKRPHRSLTGSQGSATDAGGYRPASSSTGSGGTSSWPTDDIIYAVVAAVALGGAFTGWRVLRA